MDARLGRADASVGIVGLRRRSCSRRSPGRSRGAGQHAAGARGRRHRGTGSTWRGRPRSRVSRRSSAGNTRGCGWRRRRHHRGLGHERIGAVRRAGHRRLRGCIARTLVGGGGRCGSVGIGGSRAAQGTRWLEIRADARGQQRAGARQNAEHASCFLQDFPFDAHACLDDFQIDRVPERTPLVRALTACVERSSNQLTSRRQPKVL